MDNTSIIGSNKERKSKIDFELVDKINEEYKNEKKKPMIQPTSNSIKSEELIFVTDVVLYNHIITYMDSMFREHINVLSNALKYEDGVLKGSNTYAVIATDMYLKNTNSEYRVARQIDLEQNLEMFKGFYENTGLALRNLLGMNYEQGKHIYNQLKDRGVSTKDFPIWINIQGLKLDHNLNVNLTDESTYKTANCLEWRRPFENYKEIDDFGLPKNISKSINALRSIWNSPASLTRCILNEELSLSCTNLNLDDSSDKGRIVLVKYSGGSK